MPHKNSLYKICPNCNFFSHIDEPDEYCTQCGTKLIQSCPNCNNDIDNPFAKYCKHCGESLPGRSREKEINF